MGNFFDIVNVIQTVAPYFYIMICILINIIVYSIVPIILRFGFKKKYNYKSSFLISFGYAFAINLLFTLISGQDFINTGWLYVLISFAILLDTTMTQEQRIKFEEKYGKKE